MPQLTVRLLGPPRVEVDGEPIHVDTRKAIALLAYLVVTGETHRRDELATLLWSAYDQTRARANLRRTLSALNTALDGPWLEADRETIGLDRSEGAWVDVDAFHHHLAAPETHGHLDEEVCSACLSPLAEAVDLYRDDFTAGFTLRDAPNFDDWQFFQAESLRREFMGALEKLVRGHSAQGDFEPAIDYARSWLAVDGLQETAHRQLMQLYTWAGERSAALRQYRQCVRILDEELGVAPLEETTEVYQAVKENELPSPPIHRERPTTRPTDKSTARPPDYPLVGRSAEWAVLLEAYDAVDEVGHFIVLEGEAGIGKTRLAEEFLTHAEAQGAATLTARCYQGETDLAYAAVIDALRTALGEPGSSDWIDAVEAHWLSEAGRLLPELTAHRPDLPAPPPLDRPGAQSRFFEGISQVLAALLDGPSPGVLFVDDVHWADEASLDLLTYLMRRSAGRPLCITVAWRSEGVPADHRLQYLLADALRAGAATFVSLPRLNPSDVTALLQTAALSDTPQELSERLHRESEGVPFLLVEYLKAMDGSDDEDERLTWSMPGRVRDLLRSRLAAVSETGRQLLHTAAVIGRSFDFGIVRDASGRSADETVASLEELIARGLVKEVGDGEQGNALTYDFSHEKLRALVYEETSLARRRLLHGRVADALVRRARRESDDTAGLIAHHFQRAGNDAKAAEYHRRAGEHSRSLYANAEALSHFRSALALDHSDAPELHEAIGDVQVLLGNYEDAITSFETAAALADSDAVVTLEHKLGKVYHRRGEWELAESHFEAALGALQGGEEERRARLFADWSLTAHHRGQTKRAFDLARRALQLAEAGDDTLALAQAHNILGVLIRNDGALDEAQHHLQESLALAQALDDPAAQVAALNNLALAYGDSGDLERGIRAAEAALALCAELGDRHREAALHNRLADLFHATGKSEAAMEHLKQAVAIFSEIGEDAEDRRPEIWKLVEW